MMVSRFNLVSLKRILYRLTLGLGILALLTAFVPGPLPVFAADAGWPIAPSISAEGAVVIDINSGAVLYDKNMHKHLYPASTTKLLTALLTAENAPMSDMVSFSNNAVFGIESGSSNIGIDVGEQLSVEQCLYGLMVGSGNEVANALAEHVGGSIPEFVKRMNKRATEIGCKDSHFANPNGLFNKQHYTSAYDLALIASVFFKNSALQSIGNTPTYHFTPTKYQPDDFYLHNKHKLITGETPYSGILGGKTGYTKEAGETLVTCAQKNGMTLVAVVMKEESPTQFTDTVTLLDYGFNNFKAVPVDQDTAAENNGYSAFLDSGTALFGTSGQVLSVSPDNYIVLPVSASLEDTTSKISYDKDAENPKVIARMEYSLKDHFVGHVNVLEAPMDSEPEGQAASASSDTKDAAAPGETVYLNVRTIMLILLGLAAILVSISYFRAITTSYSFVGSRRDRRRYRRRKKETHQKGRFSDY